LLVAQHLSPVLRQADYRPASVEMLEETAETPLSSV
jgi:hypothetical protein